MCRYSSVLLGISIALFVLIAPGCDKNPSSTTDEDIAGDTDAADNESALPEKENTSDTGDETADQDGIVVTDDDSADDQTDQTDQSDPSDPSDDDAILTDDLSDPSDDTVTPDIDTVPPPCVDLCALGATSASGTCTLWDDTAQQWVETLNDGDGHLHNRARTFTALLRDRLMPLGGVFRTFFTDTTFTDVILYGGDRDSPIWTGTYLAAESLRYLVTGAPDAAEQMKETVRVLDRWWRVSGDRGYLARYAAPNDSPQAVLDILDPLDPENHLNVPFEGKTWHWKGNISRDQYQGVMLGYSFAYEATQDEALKEIIRSNVVNFIEQLMEVRSQLIDFVINGVTIPYTMAIQHAVYTDDEYGPNGRPVFGYDTGTGEETSTGFINFWPNPSEYVSQLPGFGWVPDFYLRSQAIQLGGMFRVALQVTENVPAYAARRQAILDHYNANFNDWLDMADGWTNSNNCGDSYHGLNIAFEPMWNWTRLEDTPTRKLHLQNNVLRDRMWTAVYDHKNVFFAYIYSSQAAAGNNVSDVIADHNDQLAQFPPPPYNAYPVDLTGDPAYPADPSCEGLSSVAIDVKDRIPAGFLWERNPWKLSDPGDVRLLYPGIDYLIAYWMARHYGFITDDAPDTCLRWRP